MPAEVPSEPEPIAPIETKPVAEPVPSELEVPIYTNLPPTAVLKLLSQARAQPQSLIQPRSQERESDMSFLSILAKIEGVEASILAAKIPIVSTGPVGEILGIALLAEEAVSEFLGEMQAAKTTTGAATAAAKKAA